MQTLFQESRRDSLNTKSIGGLEFFLQADFKIFNFKRFLNFSAQNGRPNIITYQEQKERVVGDSKKPYTNPNHTNNRSQVIMIAENIKNAVNEEKKAQKELKATKMI